MEQKCQRTVCKNVNPTHYHRLDRTWYCEDCAKMIQGFENTQASPIEIFKEFYQVGYAMERV